ncbi:MAG TPA: extracellular solute-binding protein [Aquihabitans sp.]|nr:extracellular solute-binding protein [Aquihabitans sp.]
MSRAARTAVVAVAALSLATLAGCTTEDDGEVLKVYSGRHYDVEKAFTRFEEETGIDVEFLTGNDNELRERIAAEGEDTEADVYLTVDAGNLASAAEDGLFQALPSEQLRDVIPENYRDPEDRWFGLAIRARTIIYNTEALEETDAPTTYEEVADPAWEGRVCLRNANNPYQQSLVASMIAVHGEDETLQILEGWQRNAEIFANDVEIIEALAAGACDVAITNHYYLARALEEDPDLPVDLVWANQEDRGVHINISGGGITRYADDPALGRRFLEWLGTEGQDVLVATNHEYPANADVPAEPLISEEFGTDFVRQDVSASEFGQLNADAVRLMDEADFG